ncbi:MAG: hypothetical protein J0M19_02785 [Sphingomonadales bacterium]|nr:hypothetical protein [Sphingomonadales bacterium]
MSYWQKINPGGALADFVTVFRNAGSARWPVAVISAAITVGVFSSLAWESWKRPRAMPQVVYITSWPEDRTAEETRAFIAENQKRKEAEQAAIEAYEKEGRDLWATLGKASGMDVDKLQKQAEADRAAEKAAEQAKIDAILKQTRIEPVAK